MDDLFDITEPERLAEAIYQHIAGKGDIPFYRASERTRADALYDAAIRAKNITVWIQASFILLRRLCENPGDGIGEGEWPEGLFLMFRGIDFEEAITDVGDLCLDLLNKVSCVWPTASREDCIDSPTIGAFGYASRCHPDQLGRFLAVGESLSERLIDTRNWKYLGIVLGLLGIRQGNFERTVDIMHAQEPSSREQMWSRMVFVFVGADDKSKETFFSALKTSCDRYNDVAWTSWVRCFLEKWGNK